jgi:hypothetical protein
VAQSVSAFGQELWPERLEIVLNGDRELEQGLWTAALLLPEHRPLRGPRCSSPFAGNRVNQTAPRNPPFPGLHPDSTELDSDSLERYLTALFIKEVFYGNSPAW